MCSLEEQGLRGGVLFKKFPIITKVFPSFSAQVIPSVGLDWNGNDVNLVELRQGARGLELYNAYAGCFEEEPVTALKKALAEAHLSTSFVRVAIAGEGVVVRYILLPPLKKEEIPAAIAFDLEKQIPYKTTDVIVDYQFLEETPDKKMRVLLVAARRGLVQSVMDSLKQAGLVPVLLDIAGFAVSNAFLFNKCHPNPTETIAITHVARNMTHINIMKSQLSFFTRDIGLGQTHFQSDSALLTDLLNEMRLSFDYYENQQGDSVKAVYLSGGLDQSYLGLFGKGLGLPVIGWDPAKAITVSSSFSNKQELEKIKFQLHLAMGLAIRRL